MIYYYCRDCDDVFIEGKDAEEHRSKTGHSVVRKVVVEA